MSEMTWTGSISRTRDFKIICERLTARYPRVPRVQITKDMIRVQWWRWVICAFRSPSRKHRPALSVTRVRVFGWAILPELREEER